MAKPMYPARMRLASLLFALPLAACGSNANEQSYFPNEQKIGPDIWAVEVPAAAEYAAVAAAAKELCGTAANCKVIGWPSGSALPPAFPLTDAEVSTQIASFTLNRATGAEELLVKCATIKAPSERCM